MHSRLLTALMVVAVTAPLLAGCTTTAPVGPSGAVTADASVPLGDLEFLADPHEYVGASTAILADDAIVTPSSPPTPSLPVTVTSRDLGGDTEVTIESTDRILPMDLSGSIAATVFGLGFGDQVVGRDISTTFAGTEDLPVVTSGGHTVNSEAILALRPTVIITDGTIGPIDVVLQLRDAGIPVVFVSIEPGVDGPAALARDVAAALGAPEAGDALATALTTQIEAKIAEIVALLPDAEPLRMMFLYLRGSSGIYYLFGEEAGADSLITALGGLDVAAELGIAESRPLTDEAVVAADPDLILVMSDGLASVGGVDGLLESKPAIALTTAGQNRRFVDMADGQVLGFGPRTAAVLDALARAIYAPGQ